MFFQHYKNFIITTVTLCYAALTLVVASQNDYVTNHEHIAHAALNVELQNDSEDISTVFVINGLVLHTESASHKSVVGIPVIATLHICSNATCAQVSSLFAETSEEGVFHMTIDTTEDAIDAKGKTTEIKSILKNNHFGSIDYELVVKANHPSAPGYRAELTSSVQRVALNEPVTQLSFVLKYQNEPSEQDASFDSAGIIEKAATALGVDKGSLPWYLRNPIFSAPEHGQCLLYKAGKLQFAVLQRLFLIVKDSSQQIGDLSALNNASTSDRFSAISIHHLYAAWTYCENFVEYIQFIINLALGNIEAGPWIENALIPYQECNGFNGHVITTCTRGDGIAQIAMLLGLVFASVFLMSKALVAPAVKSRRASNAQTHSSLSDVEHEAEDIVSTSVRSPKIQRFLTCNTHIVGIGKSTNNVLTKEGSDSLFQDVTRSHVSRVAWMASSSSSISRTPVRTSRVR